MTNTLPHITYRQQEILTLLYKYRFLNRTQIQIFLNHKDKRRVVAWLKDLRGKEYIDWHYDSSTLMTRSQPAIYFMSINGIRYLRSLSGYRTEEFRNLYKESTRKRGFISRCLLVADCCIVLMHKSDRKAQYSFTLPVDYIRLSSPYSFVAELKPHLYFTKRFDENMTEYVLESLEPTLPRYRLRKRLREYVDYLDYNDDVDSLIVLFICNDTKDLLYVKRSVSRLIKEIDNHSLRIRFTVMEKIRVAGVLGIIWEEI